MEGGMNTAMIVTIVISGVSTLVNFIILLGFFGVKRELGRVDNIEAENKEIKKENQVIKMNYLDRFDEIKGMLFEVKQDVAVIKSKLDRE